MGLVAESKAFYHALFSDSHQSFVAPDAGSFFVPSDIGLKLDFPEGIDSPEHKRRRSESRS